MAGNLKPGDMVVVIACPCCNAQNYVGAVSTVQDMLPGVAWWCNHCNHHEWGTLCELTLINKIDKGSAALPTHCLRKLDPPAKRQTISTTRDRTRETETI